MKRLVDAVQDAASNSEVRARLASLGAEAAYLDTAGFESFLQTDLKRAQRAVGLMPAK